MPQGSVLGPFLHTAYTSPLSDLLNTHEVAYHFYADDTPLWLPVNLDNDADIAQCTSRLETCIFDIESWMTMNKLKLNADKTEFLVIHARPTACSHKIALQLGDVRIPCSPSARNLGVIFDSNLLMQEHISAVCSKGYWFLRN